VAANVHPSIDELDLALEELAQARTAVGADMQRGDDAVSLSESLEMVLADQEAQIADADSIQAYTNLFEYQSAYEAAIQVTANARTNLLFSRI
jgi:flagellin-like hook-associated protein FlgL